MQVDDEAIKCRKITLAAGAQAVINGALVTAVGPCQLQVGSGANVLTGRALWKGRERSGKPAEELYFSLLDVCAKPGEFAPARFRLLALLSEVVAHDRTHAAQQECATCAAALVAGSEQAAIASAQRLVEAQRPRRAEGGNVPGQSPVRRIKQSATQ